MNSAVNVFYGVLVFGVRCYNAQNAAHRYAEYRTSYLLENENTYKKYAKRKAAYYSRTLPIFVKLFNKLNDMVK